MNRPGKFLPTWKDIRTDLPSGQPPQRPPSLAPPTTLSSQFRSPYPTSQYPVPQRGFPTPALQQQQNPHRTPAVPQSPFLPTRQQAQANNFPFGAGAGVLGQNGASSLPPHMSPNPPAATTASAPSVSSTSEVVFDLNEFPALGSLSQSNNNTNASGTTNVDSTMSSSAPGSSTSNAPASNAASFPQPSSQLPSQTVQSSSQGQQAHNNNSNDNGPNQPQSQAPSLQQQQHLGAPPGVPPLGVLQNVSNGNHHIQPTPHSLSHLHNSVAQSQSQLRHHPQTPAQQVLISAADRWGLVGLLAMIKNSGGDPDGGLTSIGTDLGAIGLDMAYEGNLYSTFITPWADQSAARSVEPDFHLPPCYNVQPPPPGPSKAAAFSDETLFYMFYSSPKDALQEVAAQELWNRNWRYHKDLRTWITKESGSAPSTKIPGGEVGIYTWWDPESWCKDRKEMTVRYADLEEKTAPAFAMGPGLVLAQPQSSQGQQQGAIGQQAVVGQATTQPRMQVAGI